MAETSNLEMVLSLRDNLSKGLSKPADSARRAKGAFDGLGKSVGALAKTFVALFAAQKVIDFLKDSSKAAAESEAIYARLTAAVKDNAGATAGSAAAIDAYNQKLSQRLALDDEALNSVSAQIASMTQLSADAIPQATQAVAAFAAKTGQELPNAAMIMSKFLSGATDTVRGTTIEVDKGATAAERLAAASQFAATGMAQLEAQAATTQGQTALLAINWGNLKEAVGNFINTNPTTKAALSGLNDGLFKVTQALQGQNPEFNKWLEGVKSSGEGIKKFFEPALTWFVDTLAPKLKETWDAACAFFIEVWKKYGPLLTAIWESAWSAIKLAGTVIWEAIKLAFSTFLDLLTGVLKVGTALLKGDWQGAWEAIQETGEKIWGNVKKFFDGVLPAFGEFWKSQLDIWGKYWDGLWTDFINTVTIFGGRIQSAVQSNIIDPIGNALDGLRSKAQNLFNFISQHNSPLSLVKSKEDWGFVGAEATAGGKGASSLTGNAMDVAWGITSKRNRGDGLSIDPRPFDSGGMAWDWAQPIGGMSGMTGLSGGGCGPGGCGKGGSGGGGGQGQQFNAISAIFNQQLGQALANGILTNDWSSVGQALASSVQQTMTQLFANAGPFGGLLGGLAGGLLGGLINKAFGGGKKKNIGTTPQDAMFVKVVNSGDLATALLNAVKVGLTRAGAGSIGATGMSLRLQGARV